MLSDVDLDDKTVQLETITNKYTQASKESLKFAQSIKEGKVQLQQGQTYLQAYEIQLNKTGFSLKNVAKSALSGFKALGAGAINALGGMAIGALVGGGISLIQKAINKDKEWLEERQKAIEASEEASEKIKEINKNFKDSEKAVEDVKERYVELAQGVKNFGKTTQSQGRLSTDSYEEFLDISNQLADIFPELIQGYDDSGNAILSFDGNVQNLSKSLDEAIAKEKELASLEARDQLGDYWEGAKNLLAQEKTKEVLSAGNQDKVSLLKNTLDSGDKLDLGIEKKEDAKNSSVIKSIYKDLKAAFEENKLNLNDYIDWYDIIGEDGFAIDSSYFMDFSKADEQTKKKIAEIFDSLQKKYDGEATTYENNIEARNKEISENILSSFEYDIDNLGDSKSNLVKTLLGNMDFLDESFDGVDIETWFTTNILVPMESASPELSEEIDRIWEDILSINPNNSFSQNKDKLKEYLAQLYELLNMESTGFSQEDFYKMAGFDFEEYDKKLQDAKDKFDYTKKVTSGAGDHEYKQNITVDNKDAEKWVEDLNESDLDLLIHTTIPEDSKNWTKKDFDKFMGELRRNAGIDIELNIVSPLSTIDSDLANLESIYDQIYNLDDDKLNQTVDASLLVKLEDSFGKVDGGNALKEFQEILTSMPGDVEANQEALDKLVTSYLEQSDLIKNLSEETKDYTIQQLKSMGVENAEVYVNQKLHSGIRANTEAFIENSEAIKQYVENINTCEKDTDEYVNAVSNLKDELKTMLQTDITDENGNTVTIGLPDMSDDFIVEHLDEIKDAANGSTEALRQLRIEATQEYVANMEINADPDDILGIQNEINSLIASFDIDDVDINGSFNDTAIVKGLNHLVDCCKITRESANNILAGMGMEPHITYDTLETPVVSQVKNRKGDMIWAQTGVKKIKVPRYVYRAISSGGSAHYVSPSSSSSGSGGGGGGGSSSTSEPQTFDWIETAVTRSEESINRLGKTVGNVYDNWSKRNSALSSEISQVRSQINLQSQAYQGYINKANSIGVADIYKWKVQNGTIQIEDIADENLAKKISDYQTWYNKAIACQDAIQDLNITLGELAQTKFDNVEKEFSDLISIIEAQADIIDSKISNVEERGYFASSEFYRKQIGYEQQVLNNLNSEYSSLVAKRDEAVRNGFIKQGSEQYQEMTKSILDVQKSIEESKTSIVELNNAIRDLNWEVFDYAEERISKITDEANFLIDAFSNYDLYNENGTFNDKANATAYLHGKNYEVYLQQSKDYAEEIKKINTDIARDPSNKDLIERREELLDLQQESISNMYAEKDAIKSLVEEGINKHLEALSEMIDKYKESLNSAKDLYDYQKNISSQVKEIGNYQKMIMAYSGDNSEESKKLIQEYQNKLKDAEVNLQETQWDRMISETDTLLSNMYDDYSDLLNERLDNIDSLFNDVISGANANANMINGTIYNMANSLGYSINMLSQSIPGIKGNVFNGIKAYASGSKYIPYNQLAWTQDGGSEIIYRAKDGAILTPLGIGDMVFTHEESKNILKSMSKNNFEGFGANLIKIPDNISNNQARTINNDNMISISLPNVTNYDEFKRDLQKDPKFVGFVQEVTLGQALGRNSLNKNRY